jgi:hypothetical protein
MKITYKTLRFCELLRPREQILATTQARLLGSEVVLNFPVCKTDQEHFYPLPHFCGSPDSLTHETQEQRSAA